MQASGTTAGLRGIDSVDGKVAWASGTGGTVLRTVDGGGHWIKCAVPDAATDGKTLDFRGVQAWDAMTAIVMASGPGEKSRLYKTADGCGTWKLVFRNPDKDGFWDAMRFSSRDFGVLVGDPVNGKIYARLSTDGGASWHRFDDDDALSVGRLQIGLFAASNSALILPVNPKLIEFVASENGGGAYIYQGEFGTICGPIHPNEPLSCHDGFTWPAPDLIPLPSGNESSGAFSLACDQRPDKSIKVMVVVGGDYAKPNESTGTAVRTADSGGTWTASATPPHGYRSAVQWSEALKLWITVGTNGSDVSRDDGKTWQWLDDGNWNALSLPFVVGPQGRIARLDASA
jgi:photosystem II stability/assembly factor-like uncharacterized protein